MIGFYRKSNLTVLGTLNIKAGYHLHFCGVCWRNLALGFVWRRPIDWTRFTKG
jgi:hypothetical protein